MRLAEDGPSPGGPDVPQQEGQILVLGVGNPLRGDDGVGWTVARHLTTLGGQLRERPDHPGFAVRLVRGDALDLVDAWSGVDTVILIDAGVSGTEPGTIRHFDAIRDGLPAHWESASTHGLGVATAVEMARALGCLPRRMTVYVIEGECFAPGEKLSEDVRRAAYRLIEHLEEKGVG